MADSPNVLVLLSDQQAASTIESDVCRTPSLDRLASEGTQFTRCYAPSPVCSPSRASLLTGVLPHVHGMVNVTHGVEQYGATLRSELDTWSERLSRLGYDMGYFGKWHIDRAEDPTRFGFDVADVPSFGDTLEGFREHRRELGLPPEPPTNAEDLSLSGSVSHPGYDDYLLYGAREEPIEGTEEHFFYDLGIDFVREREDADEPWCAVVSTNGPHDPYVPPASLFEGYDPAAVEKPESFHDPMADKPNVYERQRDVWDAFDWSDYAEATACYYAFCELIDRQVGRIVAALEDTGQLNDTVIVFASDHGDLMGAHGMFLKGIPAFEEAYRVPLVLRDPRSNESGQVREEIVQLHDLAPTLVDIAGGDGKNFPPESRMEVRSETARGGENIEKLDGTPSFTALSLKPFLDGEVPDGHANEAFAECHAQDFNWTQRVYWRDDLKYVFNTFDYDELYDLRRDPAETMNVADDEEYADSLREMAGRMWEIARDTGDYQITELHYGMHRFGPVGPEWSWEGE